MQCCTIQIVRYYENDLKTVISAVASSTEGLSAREANMRLKKNGANSIRIHGEPLWSKLVAPFTSAFMWVLIIAGVVSLINNEPLDASIVLIVVAISVGIYYAQRFSTERILKALQRREAQFVQVLRDGAITQLPAESLVVGDVVLLHEGEKVPADIRLAESQNLRCDEALLTGESLPVSKQTDALNAKQELPATEQLNIAFQGTYVVSGHARGYVIATGNDTEYGGLAKLTASAQASSPVQEKIDSLLSKIIVAVLIISAIAFGLALARGMELLEALRFVMALAVSAVPEGLPVAISIILVLGMRRMAKRKTLVRSMQAMENIGTVTAIASDKTGTLTQNNLSLQTIWHATDHAIDTLLPLVVNSHASQQHDPLDQALARYLASKKLKSARPATSLPFSLAVAMSGNIHKHSGKYLLAVKGAPEQILRRSKLSRTERSTAETTLKSLASQGHKVIGLASTMLSQPINQIEDTPETGLRFAGFVTVADEIRPGAKGAVQAAQAAGIQVSMITGDHADTAFAIAKELGIAQTYTQVVDARKLNKQNAQATVYARVVPENKFRILSALKKRHITAMTGDGVNDAPALANAHVGIAMGSGTQIAKEASDIILVNNSFSSIMAAVLEGRTIFSNIRKMLFYLFATSSGEVLTMVGALALGLPLPVVAVQILWINLVTDTILVIPLGLEPPEHYIAKQPPRKPSAPILDKPIITRMILVAGAMAMLTLVVFVYFLDRAGLAYAQTIAFSLLVVTQWANVLNARSEYYSIVSMRKKTNLKLYVAIGLAVILQLLALGPFASFLHVTSVEPTDLLYTGALGVLVIIIIGELHKYIIRRRAV